MNPQEAFWIAEGGNAYTARNRVNWRARTSFWEHVLTLTGARSVFELGCNAGWNLSAIKYFPHRVAVHGLDINADAVYQARMAGLENVHCGRLNPFAEGLNGYELVFTAGVLIHVAPSEIRETMSNLLALSCQYVLAIEYAADAETEIEYRGRGGLLWKRPYGMLYEQMGLQPVRSWAEPAGFDRCTAWLMEKSDAGESR